MKRASSLRRSRPKPIGRPLSAPASTLMRRAIVVYGHVDGPAAAALHAHTEGHVLRVHASGEDVAALDAEVVVGAVALEHRAVRVLLHRRASVRRYGPRAHPLHRDVGHQPSPYARGVLRGGPLNIGQLLREVVDEGV